MVFDFQPQLDGSLIIMQPMLEADFESVYAVAADPMIWEGHPSPERCERLVFRQNINDAFSDKGGLVAIDRDTGAVIGFSRFSQRNVGPSEMEIGWTFLARSYWGGRYNRDMKRSMLKHALETFDRVLFRIAASNIRSCRAMEKIGGELIDWHEVVEIANRQVVHVAYEIRRESFFRGPLNIRSKP